MEYKIGLHTHTNLSDGRRCPEEVAKIYKEAGYDAIAITDHWKYYPDGELEGLKIFSGCEYNIGVSDTSDIVMHIVALGMKEDPCIEKGVSPQETIDKIKKVGGKAVLAHPAWSLNSVEQIKSLHGFDMLEIYNSVSNTHQSTRPYSGYIVDLLANVGISFPLTATDDAHYYDGTDETKSFIMVDAESLEWNAVANAISDRRFYASQGPELKARRDGGRIIVDCSECERIVFCSNLSWSNDRVYNGSGLTHAEYDIKENEKWVRVEIRDAEGKEAWSNIFDIVK